MNALKAIVYTPIFLIGLIVFVVTKKTPFVAAVSLRRLFCLTNGRLNNGLGKASAVLHPPQPIGDPSGVLGEMDVAALDRVCGALERDGFYVFERKLDPAICDEVYRWANEIPGEPVPRPADAPHHLVYDREALIAPKYQFDEATILSSEHLRALTTDVSMVALAQRYLGCRPINDLVACWWSAPFGDSPSSEAAQLFHFDMDRIRFLKFFVYLTDVGPEQGPHVFVRGSHLEKPRGLLRDGRIPDHELLSYYSPEDVVEITGERGTILAVDTSGYHKGKAVNAGERLLFQVEYANSLFGARYEKHELDGAADSLKKRVDRLPYTFQRFR